MIDFHEFNANKKAICEPRWVGYVDGKSKHDPCGGCPLSQPCVGPGSTGGPGIHLFNEWIDRVNDKADSLTV